MTASATASRPARPHIAIRPRRGWSPIDVREMWHFRDLVRTLAGRDIKVRYKQTALGASWVVLQPLVAAAIFAFVFGRVAALPAPGGVPYFLFAFTGLIAWNAFSNALSRSSNSIVGSSNLVSKIYFPRLLLPIASVAAILVDFLVMTALLGGLLVVFWHLPDARVLLAPAALLLMLLLALGVGFIASALAVPYRDMAYVIPVAMQFLLYASPVAYAVDAVPEQYLWFYHLNPLSSLLELFRWSVLGVGALRWGFVLWSAAVSVLLFVGGALAFHRMERDFADVV